MKLSIITICYNEPDLSKTCESIINQTCQDFEWIVIDGGSESKYQQIFEQYKQRINTFVSEKDNGIYNAYNKGVNLSNGEYLLFLNAGDYFHNSKVIENVLNNNDFIGDIVYGRIFSTVPSTITDEDEVDPEYFITRCLPVPATFFKKDLFAKYGYFNEQYRIVSDLERLIVFAKNGAKFQKIDEIVTNFNQEGISSNKKYKEKHREEKLDLIKKYYNAEEILTQEEKESIKLSFFERIFSIKNTGNRHYKHITFLGITFKIKLNKGVAI